METDRSCVSGTGGASGGGGSSSQLAAMASIEAQIQVAVAATEYATAAQLKRRLDALKASVRSLPLILCYNRHARTHYVGKYQSCMF